MAAYLYIRCALGLRDVVLDMAIIVDLYAHLDDIEAHLCDVLCCRAIVTSADIAFESILQCNTAPHAEAG